MKYVNLKNDFSVDREKDKTAPPDQELTCNWLKAGIIAGYPNSLKSDQRRIWTNIGNKMDLAVKEKSDFLEVNDIEYLFLKIGFETGTTKAEFAKYITITEDALLSATDTLPINTSAK